ncbi:MAG: hypothetical protein AAFU77_15650 [Myxococcota bacterium]
MSLRIPPLGGVKILRNHKFDPDDRPAAVRWSEEATGYADCLKENNPMVMVYEPVLKRLIKDMAAAAIGEVP